VSWQDRTEVKKGNAGERILDRWLRDKGIIPYAPVAEGAHPFDRICAMPDKRQLFIAEAKAKPARRFYPDTGVDVRVYEDYLHKQQEYGLHVFLVFIDEDRSQVYGEFMSVLDKERHVYNEKLRKDVVYPLIQNGIRFWPLTAMRVISALSPEEVKELQSFSTRRKRYAV